MLKKILLGLAAIVVSSAALAHPGRSNERHGYHYHHHHQSHYQQHYRAREHRFHESWHRPARMERERHGFVERHTFVEPTPRMASIDVHVPF